MASGGGARVVQAAGWYRDPFHRDQERYWDGRMWTQGTRPEGEGAEGAAEVIEVAEAAASTSTSTGASAADQADARLEAAFAHATSNVPPAEVPPPAALAPVDVEVEATASATPATSATSAAPSAPSPSGRVPCVHIRPSQYRSWSRWNGSRYQPAA